MKNAIMLNAIMLHGSGKTPNSFWYPSIKNLLESQLYRVWAPQLPEPIPKSPELKVQLPYVLENGEFNEETVIIGHSAGCPLTLSVLENIDVRINRAVLVSGFTKPLENYPNLILQEKYDWKKIKQNVRDLYFINSDNDPWGCDDKQGYHMFKNLGGTLIIRHGEGHMGSDTFNQPYKEFPLLEKLLSLP
jgi:predicted alpha/beta hydrolase family esterase